jgi:hypothetical protein
MIKDYTEENDSIGILRNFIESTSPDKIREVMNSIPELKGGIPTEDYMQEVDEYHKNSEFSE